MITRKRALEAEGGGEQDAHTSVAVPEDPCGQSSENPTKRRKVAKTSNRITRRRTAKEKTVLEDLPNYPLEIQLEIFRNMHPQDLYNLSKTCRTFRNFIWSKENSSVWNECFKNATDLPERPPFLSVPEFVHLLFAPYCHRCYRGGVNAIIWPWFARYCMACVPEVSARAETLPQLLGADICLYVNPNQIRLVITIAKLPLEEWRRPQYNILLSEVEMWKAEQREWRTTELKLTDRRHPAKAFISKRAEQIKFRSKWASSGHKWSAALAEKQKADVERARVERIQRLVRLVKDEGWDKEIEHLGEEEFSQKMYEVPGVKQAAKSEEEDWKRVRTRIGPFLEGLRDSRLYDARETILRPRLFELEAAIRAHYVQLPRTPSMEVGPHFVDFAFMPECQTFADAPVSQHVTSADFSSIIPVVGEEWRSERESELRGVLVKQLGNVPDDANPFDLAMGVFICGGSCSRALVRYPDILAHGCTRKVRPADVKGKSEGSHYARAVMTHKVHSEMQERTWDSRWDGSCVPFNLACLADEKTTGKVMRALRSIVSAMGLDPVKATFEELESCKTRLVCSTCNRKGGLNAKWAYGWEAALKHSLTEQMSPKGAKLGGHCAWVALKAREMTKAMMLEVDAKAEAEAKLSSEHRLVWSCALCITEWGGKWDALKAHMAEVHNKADVTLTECVQDGHAYLNHGLSKHGASGVYFAPRIDMHKKPKPIELD